MDANKKGGRTMTAKKTQGPLKKYIFYTGHSISKDFSYDLTITEYYTKDFIVEKATYKKFPNGSIIGGNDVGFTSLSGNAYDGDNVDAGQVKRLRLIYEKYYTDKGYTETSTDRLTNILHWRAADVAHLLVHSASIVELLQGGYSKQDFFYGMFYYFASYRHCAGTAFGFMQNAYPNTLFGGYHTYTDNGMYFKISYSLINRDLIAGSFNTDIAKESLCINGSSVFNLLGGIVSA